MRKLLWVGDAAVASGFAKSTHGVLETLRKTWDVSVLGLNYLGDPHPFAYRIYPCYPGGDFFGVGRLEYVVEREKPDVIVLQNDPWNIPAYVEKLEELKCPAKKVGVIPVDGKN